MLEANLQQEKLGFFNTTIYTSFKIVWLILFLFCDNHTLKPSLRRHRLCASINSLHASSPLSTIHSSRAFFDSGQAQQIFFFGFCSASFVPDGMDEDNVGCDLVSPVPPLMASVKALCIACPFEKLFQKRLQMGIHRVLRRE